MKLKHPIMVEDFKHDPDINCEVLLFGFFIRQLVIQQLKLIEGFDNKLIESGMLKWRDTKAMQGSSSLGAVLVTSDLVSTG